MIQTLKTEYLLKVDNSNKIEEIYRKIRYRAGSPVKIIAATSGGYIKRSEMALALYKGRYGVGISVFKHNVLSTRYCYKHYHIFDIEYDELKEIVSDILKIEIKEGETKWQ